MADTVESVGAEVKASLEALKGRVDYMITLHQNVVVPTPPVVIPPINPPANNPGAPQSKNDARFLKCKPRGRISASSGTYEDFSIVDHSGEPLVGFSNATFRRFILEGNEGFRIGGSNLLAEDWWMDIAGLGQDHGDGIQAYTGGGAAGNVIFRRGRLNMLKGANNAGIFCADNAQVTLTLEDIVVTGGANCPHGAIWLPNRPGDKGIHALSYKNVNFDQCDGIAGIDVQGSGAWRPLIAQWENVVVGGKQIARPW